MKICSKCKIEEYDDSLRKSKGNTWCKSCHKQYNIDNKEKLNKQRALTNLRPLSSKQNYLDGVRRIRHQ